MSSTVEDSTESASATPRRRDVLAPWGALGVTAAAWVAVAAADPGDEGRVLCPWRFVTGLDCPFCGSTRAAAALAQGDVMAALSHNALFVVVVIPLAVATWLVWVRRSRAGRAMPMLSTRVLTVGLIVVGAWWILRLLVPWLGSGT